MKRSAIHKANKEAWMLRARLELAERQCAELRQFAEIAALRADTERDRCIAKVRSACEKCDGEGWLWSHELDNADEATRNDTMTRYSCDSELCRAATSLFFDDNGGYE